jgi:hypothetical protein
MAISERLAYVLTFDTSSGVKSLEKMGATADKELGKVDSRVDKLGVGMQKFGAGAVAAAGIAGVGLFKLAGSASDLAESVNAVNVTFEDSADGIKKLGQEAARSVGLSKTEFNGLAVQFSSFAKTVAGDGGDVVHTMDELTTRAADFASVMNLDVAEAARVFQSGLAGETEPLKKFGIDLSAAAVGAYAVANGISDSAASMTEAEKVQARYGLLMQQTTQMQGDFANTADGAANQQRILKAELSNLAADIGTGVLPMFTTLVSAATLLTGAFTSLSPEMKSAVGTFGAVGVAALAIAGSLSFVVGHAITMRERFTVLGADGERSLNKIGKAAAAVSVAMLGIAAVDVAFKVINDIRDVSGSAARNLQAFEIAIAELEDGTDDGSTALAEFSDIIGDIDNKLSVSSIWEEWGKEIKIAGESASRDIEHIDAAFDKVLSESGPGAAQALLDAWTVQAEALDHSSGQYEDNIEVIGRYQDRVDLATGAAKAQSGAIADLNDEVTEATEATDAYKFSHENVGRAIDSTTQKLDAMRESLSDRSTYLAAEEGLRAIRDQAVDTGDVTEQQVIDMKMQVLDYGDTMDDEASKERVAEISTAIDKGDYDLALWALAELEKERTVRLRIALGTATGATSTGRIGGVPLYAHGTSYHPGGPAIVGDGGEPEIVNLPRGATVTPLSDVPTGGGGNTYNITINADPNPDVTVRKLREWVRRNGPIQGIT